MFEAVVSSSKKPLRFCSWPEYYHEFPGLFEQKLRPDCHPRRLLHETRSGKAIVLVHGLTDSPFYMQAIAGYFHKTLGYDVYLPLLQMHGLQEPDGMAGVSLEQWKKNVSFAVRAAAARAERVAIGGLSTGGALSFYFGCTDPLVTGEIYLFSAALGLYGGPFNIFSGMLVFLLCSPWFRLLDNGKSLQGSHPYRYARVPLNSAGELARLIGEINGLRRSAAGDLPAKRIFAAWSEYDRVINVKKLGSLQSFTGEERFVSFVIPADARVDHACVVLQEPVYAVGSKPGDKPLEVPNPFFAEMMACLHRFESIGKPDSQYRQTL